MTELSEGRSRTASARLMAVAGPNMYRTNLFRITGLPTDASPRQIRERRQRMLAARRAGAALPAVETRLPLPAEPKPDEVDGAFHELGRGEHRLVAELFWWWGDTQECGCPQQVHELHDEAVEAHTTAIEMLNGSAELTEADATRWTDAARAWALALDETQFWDHLRSRVVALNDRQLDESTMDGLRSSMPAALLRPQVALVLAGGSGRLATLIGEWWFDGAVLEDARNDAAGPLYDRFTALVAELQDLTEAGRLLEVAHRSAREAMPMAQQLNELVPHQGFRRSALIRNQLAIVLNNCAMAMMEQFDQSYAGHIEPLLDRAESLAVEQEGLDTIEGNRGQWQQLQLGLQTGQIVPWHMTIGGLMQQGRTEEAVRVLEGVRAVAPDQRQKAMAHGLLLQLSPSGRTMTTALGLAYAGVAAISAVHAPVWATFLVWLLGLPVVFVFAATRAFYLGFARAPKPVGVLTLLACLAGLIVEMFWLGFWPVLLSLLVFFIVARVAESRGKRAMNR